MQIRQAIVAGQFYPADRETCLSQIRECLPSEGLPPSGPERPVAGIVPHAGWTFSGRLAAMVFAAVKQRRPTVDTFVLFGAAHAYFGALAAMDASEAWETPLGAVPVDGALRQSLLERDAAAIEPAAHRGEHSIEVQVPFIRHLFPEARILPIVVPATEAAVPLGRAVAECLGGSDATVVCIGSTDLTHYGPRYGFTPMGVNNDGLQWATEVNDRQFIDLALSLQAQRLLGHAIENGSACGPGAAAAAMTVADQLGVGKGVLLAHTDSNEIMRHRRGAPCRDSVGYAAIVF